MDNWSYFDIAKHWFPCVFFFVSVALIKMWEPSTYSHIPNYSNWFFLQFISMFIDVTNWHQNSSQLQHAYDVSNIIIHQFALSFHFCFVSRFCHSHSPFIFDSFYFYIQFFFFRVRFFNETTSSGSYPMKCGWYARFFSFRIYTLS